MQKNIKTSLLVGLAILSASSVALAKDRHGSKNSQESRSVSYHQSAASSSSSKNFGFGFTTLGGVLTTPSLTASIDLTELDTIQALASISTTNPFQFSVGAMYKRTVAGNQETGFHLGGAFNLGNPSSVFAFNLQALAGFHFSLPGLSQIRISMDGGPAFLFANTAVASTTQFSMTSLSAALGASVIYIF